MFKSRCQCDACDSLPSDLPKVFSLTYRQNIIAYYSWTIGILENKFYVRNGNNFTAYVLCARFGSMVKENEWKRQKM